MPHQRRRLAKTGGDCETRQRVAQIHIIARRVLGTPPDVARCIHRPAGGMPFPPRENRDCRQPGERSADTGLNERSGEGQLA